MSGGFGGPPRCSRHRGRAACRLAPIKVNAVIQRGVNDHTALGLVEHFRGSGIIVRFIEYMDVGNRNDWTPRLVVPSAGTARAHRARAGR